MKTNHALIVVSGVMLLFYACTKNSIPATVVTKTKPTEKTLDTAFTTTPITASIVGKWYVNKERWQILTTNTNTVTDTTYLGNSFNAGSYYQFAGDSTATFTQGTIFFTSSETLENGSEQTVSRMILSFNLTGSKLMLRYEHPFPVSSNYYAGPYALTIIQLDADNLVLHGINSTVSGSQKTVLDAYLTRAQ